MFILKRNNHEPPTSTEPSPAQVLIHFELEHKGLIRGK